MSDMAILTDGPDAGKTEHIDAGLASIILLNMNKRREAGDYCDVTLLVGEQRQEVHAHKLLLDSYSCYFEGLFNPNMKEGKQNEIIIPNLHGPSVQHLVEFAYTGRIVITFENVERLLEAANFLAIDSVQAACSAFMRSNMQPDNCVGVLLCAELYDLCDLKDAAFDMLLKRFYDIVQAGEFCNLPVNILAEIISSEDLEVKPGGKIPAAAVQEKTVLDAVVQYLQTNGLERSSPECLQLFEHVRLPVLRRCDVADLAKSALVAGNSELMELVARRGATARRKVTDTSASPWMRPRMRAGLKMMESVAVGEKYHFRCLEAFNDETESLNSYVSGLKLLIRRWDGRPCLAGLEVLYASGERTTHGHPQPEQLIEVHEFTLGVDERIVDVSLRSGWLIDRIGFRSCTGKQYGPYGGPGGSDRHVDKPTSQQNGFLKCIKGCVGDDQGSCLICELQFVWGYYETED